MQNLEQIRENIDILDNEIVEILNKRFKLVEQVIAVKLNQDINILDTNREKKVLAKVENLAEQVYKKYILDIFVEIMEKSKEFQATIKRG